jgi:hypothetical protein
MTPGLTTEPLAFLCHTRFAVLSFFEIIDVKDNPNKIADWLIDEHGSEGAKQAALDGVFRSHDAGDNYRLSVWREVRQVLEERLSDTH